MGFSPEDLIVPGASIVGEGANLWFQAAQNKQNRKFTREMYWRQREDALADWNMQNAYNAPMAQMQRLKEAGLNPNLVYGNGAEAMSGAMPRAASSSGGQGEAPRVDLRNAAMAYYDTQLKQAGLDMVRENIELKKLQQVTEGQKVLNMQADNFNKIVKGRSGVEALDWVISQRPIMAAITRGQLDKLSANITYTLDENERKEAMNAANLRIAAETILSMRLGRAKTQEEINHIKQQIANLGTDQDLKEIELQWMKEGKTKGDWLFWRYLNDAIGPRGKRPSQPEHTPLDGDMFDSFGRPRWYKP